MFNYPHNCLIYLDSFQLIVDIALTLQKLVVNKNSIILDKTIIRFLFYLNATLLDANLVLNLNCPRCDDKSRVSVNISMRKKNRVLVSAKRKIVKKIVLDNFPSVKLMMQE